MRIPNFIKYFLRYDRYEGEILPMGLHHGNIVNHRDEVLSRYWLLRLPIPFTEHHRWAVWSARCSMHQCQFMIFWTSKYPSFAGFDWQEMPEYNYCSVSAQELMEMTR